MCPSRSPGPHLGRWLRASPSRTQSCCHLSVVDCGRELEDGVRCFDRSIGQLLRAESVATRSIPISAIASTTAGLMVVRRCGTGGANDDPVAGVVGESGGSHLGATGFVNTDEQDSGK